MSYFFNAIVFSFVFAASVSFAGHSPQIELKAKTRVAKGEAAIFQARMIGSGTKKLRLRYKSTPDEEYAWTDFERDQEGNYRASVAPEKLAGSTFYYYIVWQSDSGVVETIYGTPSEPSRLMIDRRPPQGVLHQNGVRSRGSLPLLSVKDRFGDDDAVQQMLVFAATDESSLLSHVEKGGSIGAKMSSGLIEQLGGRDLADILRSFPNFDFISMPSKRVQPVFNGVAAQARQKLKIDDLELVDEFDGSSEWTLDALNVVGVSIVDSSNLLAGETKGLLSEVRVETPRSRGFTARLRGGLPTDVAGAIVTGASAWGLENDLAGALRYKSDALIGSLLLRTQYAWDKSQNPFVTAKLQIFGATPLQKGTQRVTWNGALAFDFPFSTRAKSKIAFLAGQTFFDETLVEKKNYRLARTGLELSNDFLLHPSHLLSVNASGQFVAIANATFNFEDSLASGEKLGFEIGSCDLFGMRTGAVNNCRLKSNVNTRYRYQIANWTAYSMGLEFVSASREVNDPQSMFHPSAFLEISPNSNVDFVIGYASTLRWPTFMERNTFLKDEVEIQPLQNNEPLLAPEKLRQAILQMRWRLKSDYAHVTFDAQGRTGWLDDQITLSPSLRNGRAFVNKGSARFSALNVGVIAKLASANQIYIGSEFHTQSIIFPNMKLILGTRLNLGNLGSAHFELQSLSFLSERQVSQTRVKVFYQTRAIADHLIFEAHAAQSFSSSNLSEEDAFCGVYAGAKVLL